MYYQKTNIKGIFYFNVEGALREISLMHNDVIIAIHSNTYNYMSHQYRFLFQAASSMGKKSLIVVEQGTVNVFVAWSSAVTTYGKLLILWQAAPNSPSDETVITAPTNESYFVTIRCNASRAAWRGFIPNRRFSTAFNGFHLNLKLQNTEFWCRSVDPFDRLTSYQQRNPMKKTYDLSHVIWCISYALYHMGHIIWYVFIILGRSKVIQCSMNSNFVM